MRELRLVMEVAVEALIEDGEPVPQARAVQEYSGQLRLRLLKSQHAAAVARAEEEGVSLNALLQSYIAQGLGASQSASEHKREVAELKQELRRLQSLVEASARPSSRRVASHGAVAYLESSLPQEHRYVLPTVEGGSAKGAVRIDEFLAQQKPQKTTIRPGRVGRISLLPEEALQ